MDFKFKSNIFKNSVEDQKRIYKENYDANKPYPVFTGTLTIPAGEIPAFVEYLHWALRTELKHDDYIDDHVLPIKISGWQKESKNKKNKKTFLSLTYQPDYKTKVAAQEAKEASQLTSPEPTAESSAANLAEATAGAVVKPSKEDLF